MLRKKKKVAEPKEVKLPVLPARKIPPVTAQMVPGIELRSILNAVVDNANK